MSGLPSQSAGAGCRVSLLERAAESVCWRGLPSQSFGAGCRVSLLERAAESVCWSGHWPVSQSASPLHEESSLQGEGSLHGKLTEVHGCEILKYG